MLVRLRAAAGRWNIVQPPLTGRLSGKSVVPMMMAIALAILGAIGLGQDRNWDLLNYHLYAPHAWLHARGALDLAPAQLQSWYNPLLDVPFYLLATAPISGEWATAWLALPAGFSIWIAVLLFRQASPTPPAALMQAIVALLVTSGAAGLASLGATFNEWPVALGVLGALWLMARGFRSEHASGRFLFAAGLFLGAIAGLKLTAASYCIALGATCLLCAPADRLRLTALLGVGGVLGVALTAGYWAVHVHQQTGNPLFPYYNDVFESPLARQARNTFDLYKPKSALDALVAPWRIARGGQVFGELVIADARMLIGLVAAAVAGGLAIRRRQLRRTDSHADHVMLTLSVFLLLSFGTWLWMHAIYRYAIAIEVIGVVLAFALLQRIARPRLRLVALLALSLLILLTTTYARWGRQAFTTPFARNDYPPLTAGTVVVHMQGFGAPLGYSVIGVPDDVPVFSLSNNLYPLHHPPEHRCTTWMMDALQRLRHAHQILRVQVQPMPSKAENDAAAAFGFSQAGECQRVASTIADFYLCPVSYHGDGRCPD